MANMEPNATPKHGKKKSKRISKLELTWLGHYLNGMSAREAGRKVGLSAKAAKKSSEWIQSTREKSKRKELWDIWRKALDEQLRILNQDSGNIIRELCLIAFSSIDRFVELPSRTKSEEFIAKCKAEDIEPVFNPHETIRVKFIEDIPKELIPSIASIKETRDGIEVKLHSKMDALDKLARITKLFNHEPQEGEPFGGEINIHVKGTKSPLLLSIETQKQPPS